MEIWKDIKGYENLYQVSNQGRVKSLPKIRNCNSGKTITKEIILKGGKNRDGYFHVILTKEYNRSTIKIHRLVALHFIPNPLDLPEVNHKDGVKSNNNDWNLEWCTSSHNQLHAFSAGLQVMRKGIECYNSKLTDSDVIEIRSLNGIIKQKKLAERFGVSFQLISKIQLNKAWKHLLSSTNTTS